MKKDDANNDLERSFFKSIDEVIGNWEQKPMAEVFRIISFEPFTEYDQHKHLRIEMNYVRKGSCIVQVESESTCFSEGELMIICSDVLHSFQAGSNGCTLLQLEFLPEVFDSFTQKLSDGEGFEVTPWDIFMRNNRILKIINNVCIMRAVQRIVAEMNTRSRYYKHLVVMYYAELLILIFRHLHELYIPLCYNRNMINALCYIRLHYNEELSVKEIAAEMKISERYLRKLFMQHVRLSPLDYLNQIRIDKAIELLRLTELSVKEVCYLCGFKSPQYFSKTFKQRVGVTPKEIIKVKK